MHNGILMSPFLSVAQTIATVMTLSWLGGFLLNTPSLNYKLLDVYARCHSKLVRLIYMYK